MMWFIICCLLVARVLFVLCWAMMAAIAQHTVTACFVA
jgi:hypothetical protein